jgi:four helix bundle protein
MIIKSFDEIESWKTARELTKEIYSITKIENFSKDWGLRDQIRRASISIMANTAEGFDSGSDKSFINFLNYAYRSSSEVQSLLYVALDQKYISQRKFDELSAECGKIKNLIGGLIKYLSKNSTNNHGQRIRHT